MCARSRDNDIRDQYKRVEGAGPQPNWIMRQGAAPAQAAKEVVRLTI